MKLAFFRLDTLFDNPNFSFLFTIDIFLNFLECVFLLGLHEFNLVRVLIGFKPLHHHVVVSLDFSELLELEGRHLLEALLGFSL